MNYVSKPHINVYYNKLFTIIEHLIIDLSTSCTHHMFMIQLNKHWTALHKTSVISSKYLLSRIYMIYLV